MITIKDYIVTLAGESDVSLLNAAVREICMENRYDKVDTEKMVLACSEIGHNAIRHGGGGKAQINVLKDGKLIRVVISDRGKGIANINLALREGYSTLKTSLGLGLEAAQRLVDNFDINSSATTGTTITLEKYRPIAHDTIDYGLVSIPDDKYNYNGDQYILKEYDGDSVLLGVVDGPGQGYDAFSIAQSCKQFVENNYRKPLPELLSALNMLMQESNDEVGITCSLVRITPHEVSCIGLGDSHSYLIVDDGPLMSLTNQMGRIGYVTRVKQKTEDYFFSHQLTIVMCTDGIRSIHERWDNNKSAQKLANDLFDQYHRPNGDATILVSKFKA